MQVRTLSRIIIGIASIALLIAAKSQAASYYVATNGNDANAGTSTSAPWLTIQHAANVVPAGSTVYVRAGVYAPFAVNVSGSAAAGYTTFTNYPGETAVVDGTGFTGSYDYGLVHILDQNWITISGFEIRNGSSTSTSFGPCGVCVKSYAGGMTNIQILNNNIHNITNTASRNGNAHGIMVRGENATTPISNVTISGNTITACKTGWSENLTVSANVQYFTISNNLVHDNNNIGIDVTGGYSSEANGAVAQHGTISGNSVYNCSTINNPYYRTYSCAGLYVDGGSDIVIERNISHDNDYGSELSAETPGVYTSYVTMRNNILYHNYDYALGIGGYNSNSTGGTKFCNIVNNTMFNDEYSGNWDGEIRTAWRCTNNILENNIVYTGTAGHNIFVKDIATDGSAVGTIDYNCYYCTAGATSSEWVWNGSRSYTIGFTNWKSVSGKDAHSIFADPQFVSTSTPNFNLLTGSPALNVGNYALGATIYGTVDYAGNARTIGSTIDMGAYEN